MKGYASRLGFITLGRPNGVNPGHFGDLGFPIVDVAAAFNASAEVADTEEGQVSTDPTAEGLFDFHLVRHASNPGHYMEGLGLHDLGGVNVYFDECLDPEEEVGVQIAA